jgi:hypothetical protein
MIPAFIDEDAPPGEKDVWHMLAGGPADWTVLHALDLAPWRRNSRTELDFVVIIPDVGLLCIEVKTHELIEYREEGWFPPTLGKGPFKQSQDAVKSLHRRLKEIARYSSTIPKIGLCVFPNATFDRSCLSVAAWEVMDLSEFRRHPSAASFCRALRDRLVTGRDEEGIIPLSVPLEAARVDNLVDLCLPIRKRVPERRLELAARENQLAKVLREPQKVTIQLCQDNDRVLATGGAGTGKTLIAMELALQASQRFNRVALVCYNKLVGEWMCERIKDARPGPSLVVDRAVKLLAGLADVPIPKDADDRFWNVQLPEQVQDRLTDPQVAFESRFDYLIVDEVQDILARPWMWESLMLLLEGGAAGGRFALFGDIEGQSITGAHAVAANLDELTKASRPVKWQLRENCRNYDVVGNAAVQLSGLPANTYTGFLRSGGSFRNIEYVPITDDGDQVSKLKSRLQAIRSSGYRDSDITILSFCAPEKSAARSLVQEGARLFPVGSGERTITYTSVHAFKGMENKIIVVTDLNLANAPASRALFYTALTRATESVHILSRPEDSQQILSWRT